MDLTNLLWNPQFDMIFIKNLLNKTLKYLLILIENDLLYSVKSVQLSLFNK